MPSLAESVDAIVLTTGFSGVVSVRTGDTVALEAAYGLANRADEIPNTLDTRFGIASGTKGLTALTVMGLIEAGVFELATTARSILGNDLPLIDRSVTIEALLAHRSGIGDYLDEELVEDLDVWPFAAPAHTFTVAADYLAVLDGHPQKFAPGSRFSYCNGGYVVLALICERATGAGFHELVRDRVCEPAGMTATAFLAMNKLPADTARGYLDDGRENTANLPRCGSGDGGIFSTVADIGAFWSALFAGTVVSAESVATMEAPRSEVPWEHKRYGLGFWLHPTSPVVMLEGLDAGVSFRSNHDPVRNRTATVISNTADGVWPIVRHLEESLTI